MFNDEIVSRWQRWRKLSESRIIADYTDFADYAPAERYVMLKLMEAHISEFS